MLIFLLLILWNANVYSVKENSISSTEGYFQKDQLSYVDVNSLLFDIETFHTSFHLDQYRSRYARQVKFSCFPNHLDFGPCPIYKPTRRRFVITNLSENESIVLYTASGNNEVFFPSGFNETFIIPTNSATINVIFLPQKPGLVEGDILIDSSIGLLRFSVFGSGYFDSIGLFPVVYFNSNSESQRFISVEVFNPSNNVVSLENPAYFTFSNGKFSGANRNSVAVLNSCFILMPLASRTLFVYSSTNWRSVYGIIILSFCLSNVAEFNPPTLSQSVCNQPISILGITAHDTCSNDLVPATTTLYFGIITAEFSKQLSFDVFSCTSRSLSITRVVVTPWDPSVVLHLVNRPVIPGLKISQTIAFITISAKNVSKTHELSGFVTAFTGSLAVVSVPFYARLVHGHVYPRITNHTDGINGLRFRYILGNAADVPVFVFPPSIPQDLQQYTIVHTCSPPTLIQPKEEHVLLELSSTNWPHSKSPTNLSVRTNISTVFFHVEPFSGLVDVTMSPSLFLDGVYDLGHVIAGQSRLVFVQLTNPNPFKIHFEIFLVSSSSSTGNLVTISSRSKCTANCTIWRMNQRCLGCFTHILPHSNLSFPLTLNASSASRNIFGFFLLQTPYQRLERRFAFRTTLGEITVSRNSLVAGNLFPGRVIRQQLTVSSTYPQSVVLTSLRVISASGISVPHVRVTDFQANHSLEPLSKPAVVGSIQIDPSLLCIDVGAHVRSQKPTSDLRGLCYCGFDLDSALGFRILRSSLEQLSLLGPSSYHSGYLFESMMFYAELHDRLRSAWLATSDTTLMNSSAFLQIDAANATFRTELSLSYIWPHLVRPSFEFPIASHHCTIDGSLSEYPPHLSSLTAINKWKRIQLLYSLFDDGPVHGHFVIQNPSDRPLIVQPMLLSALVSASNLTNASPVILEVFNALGAPSLAEEYFSNLHHSYGSFKLEVTRSFGMDYYSKRVPYASGTPACCPLLVLAPQVGSVVLRLSFSRNHTKPEHYSKPFGEMFDLLFVGNNLTGLELLPVEVRYGTPSLALVRFDSNMSSNRPSRTMHMSTISRIYWERKNGGMIPSNEMSDNRNSPDNVPLLNFSLTDRIFLAQCLQISQGDSHRTVELGYWSKIGHLVWQFQLNNTGDVPLRVFSLMPGPSSGKEPHTSQVSLIHTSFSEYPTCVYSGFSLTPCLLPITHGSHVSNDSTNGLLIPPGSHLPLKIHFLPDLVHLSRAMKIWISFASVQHVLNTTKPDMPNMIDSVPLVRLRVEIPRQLFETCLGLIPRPLLEGFIWLPVLVLFTATLLLALFLGFSDGKHVHRTFNEAQNLINRNNSTVAITPNLLAQQSASCIHREKCSLNSDDEHRPTICVSSDASPTSNVTQSPQRTIAFPRFTVLLIACKNCLLLVRFLVCWFHENYSRVHKLCKSMKHFIHVRHSLNAQSATASELGMTSEDDYSNMRSFASELNHKTCNNNNSKSNSLCKMKSRGNRSPSDERKQSRLAPRTNNVEPRTPKYTRSTFRRKKTFKFGDNGTESRSIVSPPSPSLNANTPAQPSVPASMSEAQIAAAIRATLRLSEGTTSDSRKTKKREKTNMNLGDSSYSSTSSCVGDGDAVQNNAFMEQDSVSPPDSPQILVSPTDGANITSGPSAPASPLNKLSNEAKNDKPRRFYGPPLKPIAVTFPQETISIVTPIIISPLQAELAFHVPLLQPVSYRQPLLVLDEYLRSPINSFVQWDASLSAFAPGLLQPIWSTLLLANGPIYGNSLPTAIGQIPLVDKLYAEQAANQPLLVSSEPDAHSHSSSAYIYQQNPEKNDPNQFKLSESLPLSDVVPTPVTSHRSTEEYAESANEMTMDSSCYGQFSCADDEFQQYDWCLDESSSLSNGTSEHSVSWPKQTHFFELPQIMQSKLLAMLEHESQKFPRFTSQASSPDDMQPKTTIANPDFVHGGAAPGIQSTLFEPSDRSTFQPWVPVDLISQKEILETLGLDETDELLHFGPNFSYLDCETDKEELDFADMFEQCQGKTVDLFYSR